MRWRFTQDVRDLKDFKSTYETKRIEKAWAKIKKRLERPLESEYKLAVIEADDFLNDIFRGMKYKGESFGDRLKQVTPDILPNIEEVKRVHEIRNNIVHDPDYQLSLEQAQVFIKTFEKALQDLNIFS